MEIKGEHDFFQLPQPGRLETITVGIRNAEIHNLTMLKLVIWVRWLYLPHCIQNCPCPMSSVPGKPEDLADLNALIFANVPRVRSKFPMVDFELEFWHGLR